jgi:hypothetical protein
LKNSRSKSALLSRRIAQADWRPKSLLIEELPEVLAEPFQSVSPYRHLADQLKAEHPDLPGRKFEKFIRQCAKPILLFVPIHQFCAPDRGVLTYHRRPDRAQVGRNNCARQPLVAPELGGERPSAGNPGWGSDIQAFSIILSPGEHFPAQVFAARQRKAGKVQLRHAEPPANSPAEHQSGEVAPLQIFA